jgi:hypothetical protein
MIFWLGKKFQWFRKLYYRITKKYCWGIVTMMEDFRETMDMSEEIDMDEFDKWFDKGPGRPIKKGHLKR